MARGGRVRSLATGRQLRGLEAGRSQDEAGDSQGDDPLHGGRQGGRQRGQHLEIDLGLTIADTVDEPRRRRQGGEGATDRAGGHHAREARPGRRQVAAVVLDRQGAGQGRGPAHIEHVVLLPRGRPADLHQQGARGSLGVIARDGHGAGRGAGSDGASRVQEVTLQLAGAPVDTAAAQHKHPLEKW